ncbi:MAG: hypothetical protein QM766_23430 [Burkholderiaceae bacterium]
MAARSPQMPDPGIGTIDDSPIDAGVGGGHAPEDEPKRLLAEHEKMK